MNCDRISNERERASHAWRRSECPLCGCKESEGHEGCFHCLECGYLQCCDCDGFYDKEAKRKGYWPPKAKEGK
jgi:hypothetical protein